jgi:hypothetical protein
MTRIMLSETISNQHCFVHAVSYRIIRIASPIVLLVEGCTFFVERINPQLECASNLDLAIAVPNLFKLDSRVCEI